MTLDYRTNLGNLDRIIRAAAGVLLLFLVFAKTLTGWWAVAAVALALFQFVEAALAY